jgi:uncharacterized protein involved in type VI secretion and phage assembly
MSLYYGKYRGTVINNKDTEGLGQVQVQVPEVLGDVLRWALPAVPYAGPQVGLLLLPPVHANVWVEFEGGRPESPIWSGCFWGKGELPVPRSIPEVQAFKTTGASLILSSIDDGAIKKGLCLEITTPLAQQPLTITMNATGIEISNNKQTIITLTADDIQVTDQQSHITLKADSIALQNNQTTVNMTADSIALKSGSAEVQLSASGAQVKNGAQSIQLSTTSVSVNNGALEVM